MTSAIRHALSVLTLLVCSAATAVQAAEPAPDVLLEKAMHTMVHELNAQRDAIARDPAVVQQLAERILLPHVDFVAASRQVLGKHWRRASREQKLAFVRQFRTLLLRFYSTALAKYLRENTLDPAMFVFAPLRGDTSSGQITVHMELHPPGGGKPIPVNYLMHHSKKGWRVYDLAIDGVSLIATYRNSFASQIRNEGLDALIARLAEKNARLESTAQESGEEPSSASQAG